MPLLTAAGSSSWRNTIASTNAWSPAALTAFTYGPTSMPTSWASGARGRRRVAPVEQGLVDADPGDPALGDDGLPAGAEDVAPVGQHRGDVEVLALDQRRLDADGAQATCHPSSANFSSASASYSHVAEVRSHVQCSVATAVEPVRSTPAVSTRTVAEPSSWVIRSYDACARRRRVRGEGDLGQVLGGQPGGERGGGVLRVRLVGSPPSSLESPVQPATPRDEGEGERRRPEVASCRPLYRAAPGGWPRQTCCPE